MPELTERTVAHIELTSAYDERKRTFDALRDLTLSPQNRVDAEAAYLDAALSFNNLRSKLGTKTGVK